MLGVFVALRDARRGLQNMGSILGLTSTEFSTSRGILSYFIISAPRMFIMNLSVVLFEISLNYISISLLTEAETNPAFDVSACEALAL